MTELWSAALGAAGTVIRYGHWGHPALVFPSERGRAWDFENNGIVGAVADLTDAGRLKRANEAYFNNPVDYVANLEGDHLEWLRSQVSLLLVCGQGQREDTTGVLAATRKFGALPAEKGIRHELDVWGYDVPHDWPSWRVQLAHHMLRFC